MGQGLIEWLIENGKEGDVLKARRLCLDIFFDAVHEDPELLKDLYPEEGESSAGHYAVWRGIHIRVDRDADWLKVQLVRQGEVASEYILEV